MRVFDSEAEAHFGWLGMMAAMDAPTSRERTSARLVWVPTQSGLLADIGQPEYGPKVWWSLRRQGLGTIGQSRKNKKGPEGPFVSQALPDLRIWSGRWDSNPRP